MYVIGVHVFRNRFFFFLHKVISLITDNKIEHYQETFPLGQKRSTRKTSQIRERRKANSKVQAFGIYFNCILKNSHERNTQKPDA